MAKEPEDFSKLEDKFKLSLMQTEKRILDLEVSLSGLSSKIGESKGLDEIKQRVDDLEDLIMVENVGVTELKKMMENVRDNIKPPELPDMSGIEKKITDLENQVSCLPKPESVDLGGIESDVKNLDETVETLKSGITEVHSQINLIISEINSFRKEVGTDIQGIKTNRPEVAIQFLTSRLESFRAANDDLQTSMDAIRVKLQNLESKFSDSQKTNSGLPDDANRKIESMQQDWLGINSRMDSVEAVIKGFYKSYDALQVELKKFDTFDKASTLKEDLEKKFEEFKFVESEIKRLSTRIEMVYENIDKRLDKVKDLEKRIPGILQSVENLAKENDKIKIEILDRVKKDDLDSVRNFVDETANKISRNLESVKKSADEKTNNLFSEIDASKRLMGALQKDVSNLRQTFFNTKQPSRNQDAEKIYGRISQLESRTDSRIKEVDERIRTISVPQSPFEEDVKEIVERLVFLETRLAAIEKLMQESNTVQPIILE